MKKTPGGGLSPGGRTEEAPIGKAEPVGALQPIAAKILMKKQLQIFTPSKSLKVVTGLIYVVLLKIMVYSSKTSCKRLKKQIQNN